MKSLSLDWLCVNGVLSLLWVLAWLVVLLQGFPIQLTLFRAPICSDLGCSVDPASRISSL
jgi:hypothetical protein